MDHAAPEIIRASLLGDAALAALFEAVYSDYYFPMHVDAEAFRSMVGWFDVDLDASRVARGSGGDDGIVLVARRGPAAWIGGMGVVPGRRRSGTGARLMEAALAEAAALGAHEVQLEVLEQNAPAIALYERLGFRRDRELEVWSFSAAQEVPHGLAVAPLPLSEARAFIRSHRLAREPWQRADATLDRMLDAGPVLDATGVHEGARLIGAAVHRAGPGRVSVLQYAGEAGHGPGVAAAVIGALAAPGSNVRFLNVQSDDAVSVLGRASQANREAGQIEMRRAVP